MVARGELWWGEAPDERGRPFLIGGVDVAFDFYPYTAGGTGFYQLLPEWANAGGQRALHARLNDPSIRKRRRSVRIRRCV